MFLIIYKYSTVLTSTSTKAKYFTANLIYYNSERTYRQSALMLWTIHWH